MNTLLNHFRRLFALILLATPLAWATVSMTGLTIQQVPQLSFAQALIERAVNSAPFTQTAISRSPGTVTYSSGNPAVATVNASTGAVTPLSVGETVITANQAASGAYPSATASYTLRLSGQAVVFQGWTLPARTYGDAPFTLTPPPPPTARGPSPTAARTPPWPPSRHRAW